VPRARTQVTADAFGRVTLPRFECVKPGDTIGIERLGRGSWRLTIFREQRLATPKFKRVLEALDNPARNDIYQRQFIRHCLETFRPDRGSLTGRIVFQHALRAKHRLFLAKPALNHLRKIGMLMLWV